MKLNSPSSPSSSSLWLCFCMPTQTQCSCQTFKFFPACSHLPLPRPPLTPTPQTLASIPTPNTDTPARIASRLLPQTSGSICQGSGGTCDHIQSSVKKLPFRLQGQCSGGKASRDPSRSGRDEEKDWSLSPGQHVSHTETLCSQYGRGPQHGKSIRHSITLTPSQ